MCTMIAECALMPTSQSSCSALFCILIGASDSQAVTAHSVVAAAATDLLSAVLL